MQFYGIFFMRLRRQSSGWEGVLGTNGLPADEHKMFETCRRHEELN